MTDHPTTQTDTTLDVAACLDPARLPLISVVLPAHNEAENVGPASEQILRALAPEAIRVELIFVDDGSTDDTADRVAQLAARDPRIGLVELTRNFGHQLAVLAGMEAARGDAVITMDCDLQHPPERLPEMLRRWREGYRVVQMVRDDTAGVSWLKRRTSNAFYRILNLVAETPLTAGAADFQLFDRAVLTDLLAARDCRPVLRGLVAWSGHSRATIRYVADSRRSGRSSYTLRKMLRLSIDAITAFSSKPLRIAFYLGVLTSLLSLSYLFVILVSWVRDDVVRGWSSIMFAVLLLGAVQLMTIGILGEYIGRIFEQTRDRPRYVVARRVRRTEESGTDPR